MIKNVIAEVESRVNSKKNLEGLLLDYFEEYSKTHRHFFDRIFKIPKEEDSTPVNKFANMKEEMKRGVIEMQ